MEKAKSERLICSNRKAFHNYSVEKKMEAGVVLLGSEVKSLREGNAHLNDAYVDFQKSKPYLYHSHIAPYACATHEQHDPFRVRPLLLNKREIAKLEKEVKLRGYAVIPLKLYFKGSRVKIEIALAKGKKQYDKREDMKKKESQRDIQRQEKWK
jgi:SsrA-binding protein